MSEKSRLDYILDDRRHKLADIRSAGVDPYPSITHRTHLAQDAKTHLGDEVGVAGRIVSIREHGKTIFADLSDQSGPIQINWRVDKLSDEAFAQVGLIDVGDLIEATGKVENTSSGQPTVIVEAYQILAKAIRPAPRQWQELENVDERFRRRYVDMMVDERVGKRFILRSQIIQAIRDFYLEHGFLEVETPILQSIPGGAMARPFQTHYNAYDQDVYLRIAPELYLKRLLVGGFERVFEIARCFRNEQADTTHNPEFTQVESYVAYWDYEDTMAFVEDLLCTVVQKVFGTDTLEIRGKQINFKRPFARQTFLEVSGGHREDAKFKQGTQGIIQPTFVTNHPI